jgi:hypothetical protein
MSQGSPSPPNSLASPIRGWWTQQPGLPQLWRSLIDFEAKAIVPGLLQTAEYERAIIKGVAPAIAEAELGNRVAARTLVQEYRPRDPSTVAA